MEASFPAATGNVYMWVDDARCEFLPCAIDYLAKWNLVIDMIFDCLYLSPAYQNILHPQIFRCIHLRLFD